MRNTGQSNRLIFIIVLSLAAIIYITTAYNSHGFYHGDEHYQIIEFAGLKLGTHTPNDLAWEFKEGIRPAIQPTICFVVFKFLNNVEITNPYTQVLVLRLVSITLALLIISFFVKHTEKRFETKKQKTIYYLVSYLLWFIPFLSTRFSSETWSGLFFLLALGVFLCKIKDKHKYFLSGLALGFSFSCRFQIIFAIAGFGLWLLIIHKANILSLVRLGCSFIFVVLIGLLIDSWFYGELIFTPLNYFYKNIVEDVASKFGTSTWYYYLLKLLSYPTYFIGIPLTVSLVVVLILNPRNLFIWCFIPFFIIHSIVPHKEERFIFPMVYLFPVIMVTAYKKVLKLLKNKIIIRILNYCLAIIFIIINAIGLTAMSQKAAGIGRMEISKYIHDNYGNQPVNLIYTIWSNPYDPWHKIVVRFYIEKDMTRTYIHNLCDLTDSTFLPDRVNLLVFRNEDLWDLECKDIFKKFNLHEKKQAVPEWIEKLNGIYKGFNNKNIIHLYSDE